MSGTKVENRSTLRILPTENGSEIIRESESCWRTVGVWGDRSCGLLHKHTVCSNCEVYASVQAQLLAREIPDYGEYEQNQIDSGLRSRDALFLCVAICGSTWAFPLASLSRVAPPQAIHSLPHTRNILGITSFDGQILPVVDLGALLLREYSDDLQNGWFILFAVSDGAVAARVDKVLGITAIPSNDIIEYPVGMQKALAYTPTGIAKTPPHIAERHQLPSTELLVADISRLEKCLRDSLMG